MCLKAGGNPFLMQYSAGSGVSKGPRITVLNIASKSSKIVDLLKMHRGKKVKFFHIKDERVIGFVLSYVILGMVLKHGCF